MWFSIGGPTAVGKTSLALHVAEMALSAKLVTGVDLISADSRQVYKGLEITSGVDIPPGFRYDVFRDQSTFVSENDLIRIWGVSQIEPSQEWSVAHFQKFALPIIEAAEQAGRMAVVVGGTGLYQQQLLQTDPMLHVGPNPEVREQAEVMTVPELQTWLQRIADQKWQQMNPSDRANPRRLVRAIEMALAKQVVPEIQSTTWSISRSLGTICLIDKLEKIEMKIGQRVDERLAAGAAAEVERLQASYPNQKLPVFSATGVKVLSAYQAGEIDLETTRALWTKQEKQYAKRQITWYKKQPDITWFSLAETNWRSRALEIIRAWLVSE